MQREEIEDRSLRIHGRCLEEGCLLNKIKIQTSEVKDVGIQGRSRNKIQQNGQKWRRDLNKWMNKNSQFFKKKKTSLMIYCDFQGKDQTSHRTPYLDDLAPADLSRPASHVFACLLPGPAIIPSLFQLTSFPPSFSVQILLCQGKQSPVLVTSSFLISHVSLYFSFTVLITVGNFFSACFINTLQRAGAVVSCFPLQSKRLASVWRMVSTK